MLRLLALFFTALLGASAATYYVDCSAANDNSAGTSTGTAWKTIAKLNATALQPADTVRLNKGCTWAESLIASAGVIYTNYGSGALPILAGITITGQANVTLDGLESDAATRGVDASGLVGGLHITNSVFQTNTEDGIKVDCTNLVCPNITIEHSTSATNGGIGIWTRGGTTNELIQYNTAHDNNKTSANTNMAGIYVFSDGDHNTPPTHRADTIVIAQYNDVYNNGAGLSNGLETGYGIWFDTVGPGSQIRYNRSHANRKGGIQLEFTGFEGNQSVYGNVSYGNQTGIVFSRRCWNSTVANNTMYGNTRNLWVQGEFGGGDTYKMVGNLIENNLTSGATTSELRAIYGMENDGTNGYANVYRNNSFGAPYTSFIEWGFGAFLSTYSALDTAYGTSSGITPGAITNSVSGNPLFVNASGNDFTLQPASPAIDAATNAGSSYRFALDPRSSFPWTLLPQGAAWEIGAFVYPGALVSGNVTVSGNAAIQ